MSLDTRPSPIAGQWYPGDPKKLAASVDSYLDQAGAAAIPGDVVALMSPHAGHLYCGAVAGKAYAAVRGLRPDVVAVISPCHYPYYQPLITTAHAAYQTPLGAVPVDGPRLQALDAALRTELGFGLTAVKRDPEHSLEIELPFLQRALAGEFHLLPVMVRDQGRRTVFALGQALAKLLAGSNFLLVASTDLSHFYTEREANQLDAEFLRRVEAFDPEAALNAEDEGKAFACGRAAVAAVLWAARALGADTVKVSGYATSGDVTGDRSQVVGYGAAVVFRSKS